jgi:hypothetical protein
MQDMDDAQVQTIEDCDTLLDACTKEGLLLRTLVTFFQNVINLKKLVPIISESSPVSLRVLDWFVTNYSREHTKRIVADPILFGFDVYNSYKSQLKAFNKKLFDPFCRLHSGGKIKKFKFIYKSNPKPAWIITTTGQLNFFKWAIENDIITYVAKYHDEIKVDLKTKESLKKNSSQSTSSVSALSPTSPTSPIYWDSSLTTDEPRKQYVIHFD